MKNFLLALFVCVPMLAYAECNLDAIKKVCEKAPFIDNQQLNDEELNTLSDCRMQSNSYQLNGDDTLTADRLNEFCKGI